MAGTTTIKANAAGSTGDLSKWNEDPGYDVTGAVAVNKTFDVTGDQTSKFTAGKTFAVIGSAANDGDYTVVSSAYGDPTTVIVVAEAVPANSGASGTIKKHRVPVSADVVDINGKRVVQDGAFTAVAEIKDSTAHLGKFVVTGPFTPTLVTGVVVFDALPPGVLNCG